jgi:hypothetical protein
MGTCLRILKRMAASDFGYQLKREEFIKKYNTSLFVSNGIVKKEFVLVPDKLLLNRQAFKPYFDISFKNIASLKAK